MADRDALHAASREMRALAEGLEGLEGLDGAGGLLPRAREALDLLQLAQGLDALDLAEARTALDPLALFDDLLALAVAPRQRLDVRLAIDTSLPARLLAPRDQWRRLVYHFLKSCLPADGRLQFRLAPAASASEHEAPAASAGGGYGAALGVTLVCGRLQASRQLLGLVAALDVELRQTTAAGADQWTLWLPFSAADGWEAEAAGLAPALVLTEDPGEREALAIRLARLGVGVAEGFDAHAVSCCFVRGRDRPAFRALTRRLPPETPVIALGAAGRDALPTPVRQRQLQEIVQGLAAREGRQLQALVVDDSEASRLILARQLRALGQEATLVDSGEAALRLDDLGAYGLAFVDLQLPGMGGAALARALRTRGLALPIYGMSAHATQAERQQCLAAGMAAVLLKPLRASRLRSLVRLAAGEAPAGALPQAAAGAPQKAATGAAPVAEGRDLPVFDWQLALANADASPELAEELMAAFIQGLDEDQQRIKDALDALHAPAAGFSHAPAAGFSHESAAGALAREIHRLNGALSYCGLPRLQQAAAAMETALHEEAPEAEALGLLAQRLMGEMAALRTWYGQAGAGRAGLGQEAGQGQGGLRQRPHAGLHPLPAQARG